jgi:hypothetical protein
VIGEAKTDVRRRKEGRREVSENCILPESEYIVEMKRGTV